MTHKEILDMLVDCIADVDRMELYGTGDKLMDVIEALKADWQTRNASQDTTQDD